MAHKKAQSMSHADSQKGLAEATDTVPTIETEGKAADTASNARAVAESVEPGKEVSALEDSAANLSQAPVYNSSGHAPRLREDSE